MSSLRPGVALTFDDVLLVPRLAPAGHLILATLGPEGLTRCSGLEVQRYPAAQLSGLRGPDFELVRSQTEDHITPQGNRQQFLYGWWTRAR